MLRMGQLGHGLKWHALVGDEGHKVLACKPHMGPIKSTKPYHPSVKGLCERYECEIQFSRALNKMDQDTQMRYFKV